MGKKEKGIFNLRVKREILDEFLFKVRILLRIFVFKKIFLLFEEEEKVEQKLEEFGILEEFVILGLENELVSLSFFKVRSFLRFYMLKKGFFLFEKEDSEEVKQYVLELIFFKIRILKS